MNRTAIACTTIASVSAVAIAALLALGPLNPPSGALTSTNKTLTEIEPRIAINATNTLGDANSLFRISSPGSYYLTGNITGVAGKSGIEIAASNVTIDLMGFDVRGVTGALQGIVSSGGFANITVRNGTVGGWPSGGVVFNGNGVFVCQDLHVNGNTGFGISMDTGRIEGCIASSNTAAGLRIAQGGTLARCFSTTNGGVGIDAGIMASVTNCSAVSNTGNGFLAGGNCVIAQCTSQQNGGAGFSLDFASLLTDSVSRFNTGVGIDAKGGATVRGCTADRNSQDGILAASRSLIINNSLTLNGQDAATTGAGIRVSGADNRIEGNNCAGNDNGIRADAAGNIIIKNTCSGNTSDWEIVANNIYGPIIDRRLFPPTTTTPAVSGSVGATSTLGTTDPNANFSY